jgi:vanillate O-demethylase ferredoxin subunit
MPLEQASAPVMGSSTLAVRVAARCQEAEGICAFELVHPEGQDLPAFTAGAHIDVHLPNGLVRPYSLCNAPSERHRYLIAVLHEPASRGGSHAMHEEVAAGALLRISAPKNHFALAPQAEHSLLLAGGIGITPLLAMAEALTAAGASFELHVCARSRARAAFHARLAAADFSSRVLCHFDDGADAQKLDIGALLAGARPGTHLYVCGPKGFMDAVLGAARSGGWDEARLHFEFFTGDIGASDADTPFQVQIASSGQIIDVSSSQTVTEALADAGVVVETSCEQGVCGTCLTRVLVGDPDHRDLFLTPAEKQRKDQMLPCCSRSHSPLLVLDL